MEKNVSQDLRTPLDELLGLSTHIDFRIPASAIGWRAAQSSLETVMSLARHNMARDRPE